MIRKIIIVALLTGASLIVWLLFPFHVASFVLTLVLLIACAALLTRRPVQRHRAVRIGLVVGIIGLVPYLVITAVVWRVNLSIFGNRVSPEPIQPAAAIMEAPKGTLEES